MKLMIFSGGGVVFGALLFGVLFSGCATEAKKKVEPAPCCTLPPQLQRNAADEMGLIVRQYNGVLTDEPDGFRIKLSGDKSEMLPLIEAIIKREST